MSEQVLSRKCYLQNASSHWRVVRDVCEVPLLVKLRRRVVEVLHVDADAQRPGASWVTAVCSHDLHRKYDVISMSTHLTIYYYTYVLRTRLFDTRLDFNIQESANFELVNLTSPKTSLQYVHIA